jgi:N-acetylmuramoyl-L-alanine amidase
VLHAAPTNRLLLVLLLGATLHAQVPRRNSAGSNAHAAPSTVSAFTQTVVGAEPAADPSVVFLDPAHGGDDAGAHLSGGALEKDTTLALANKLRSLLTARGFKVVMTRTNAADNASTNERIDLEERTHPSACLLLHASDGGHGVHLYTSTLNRDASSPQTRTDRSRAILPWDTVQTAALSASMDLAGNLITALNGIEIPLVTGRASVSPIDSLSCPAVAIELAPYTPNKGTLLQPSNYGYQDKVAKAIVTALTIRREHLARSRGSATNAARQRNTKGKPGSQPLPKPKGVQKSPRTAAPPGQQP